MNVLIAVDGSESSWDAVRFAADLLSPTDEVVVINVASPVDPAIVPAGELAGYASAGYAIPAALRDTGSAGEHDGGSSGSVAKAIIHDAAAALGATEAVVESGGVVERICSYAETAKTDLVIVGTRDPGLFNRILTGGSISREIVNQAPCSVLVVR